MKQTNCCSQNTVQFMTIKQTPNYTKLAEYYVCILWDFPQYEFDMLL